MVGCSHTPISPLKINPCSVLTDIDMCLAVPINQGAKPDYERLIMPSDSCMTSTEYSQLQKDYREILKRCGDKCR